MKQYIGSKIVNAEPMRRSAWHEGKGWPIPMEEDWDGEGYKVRYEDGYESWSPKEVFEAAYRRTDGLSFGLALEAAKKGKRIARQGWNGKGMYVFLAQGVGFHTYADITDLPEDGFDVLDCLCMRTADGNICPGWLASQTDMLADDWTVLDGEVCWTWDNAKEAMKVGAAVRRKGWEDDSWVAILEEPVELKGKLCKVSDEDGLIEPDWEPEGEDLEAKDWAKLWGV